MELPILSKTGEPGRKIYITRNGNSISIIMSAKLGKRQSYTPEEDAHLLEFRRWGNEQALEGWSQFLARYKTKYWIDTRSPGALSSRARQLSGYRHLTLSRDEDMMHHILKIYRSSTAWTWGRIGQIFGTTAETVYAAYKTYLKKHGLDEVENESARIKWTKTDRERLARARRLKQPWERIARQFGHEEYICITAHYIHSYDGKGYGHLDHSFHPKYLFTSKEGAKAYPIRRRFRASPSSESDVENGELSVNLNKSCCMVSRGQ